MKAYPWKAPEGAPNFAALLRHPVDFISFGFGTGLIYPAPGTWGTLLGIPVFWLLLLPQSLPIFLAGLAIAFLFGCWCCGVSTRRMGVHDHSGIVWDEVVGFVVTMLPTLWFLPNLVSDPAAFALWSAVGFLLFRVFDIIKPWPIRLADRHVEGGFGIMIDDVLAGIEAAAVLAVLLWYFV